MKNFFYLSIIAILLAMFSSCDREGQKVESTNQVNQADKDSLLIDSLTTVIKNIGSSDYDIIVAELKKLPKYENAIFLSPKENEEYLNVIQKNADRFRLFVSYRSEPGITWFKRDDSTLVKFGASDYYCQIIFDTLQSSKPLLELRIVSTKEEKNIRTKKTINSDDRREYSYYYIPGLKLGYIVAYHSFYDYDDDTRSWSIFSRFYTELEFEVLRGFKKSF